MDFTFFPVFSYHIHKQIFKIIIGIEALPARFDRRGVLYPLQTFTQGRSVDFAKIPLFVEGNDDTFIM